MGSLVEALTAFDQRLFLLLNGAGTSWWDPVMIFCSKVAVWIPLYAALLGWLFYRLPWRRALAAVIGLLVVFAVGDQLSGLIKDIVQRPRPNHQPQLEGLVRLLESPGGLYGFVSSHAANVFGLACFLGQVAKRSLGRRALYLSIPLYLWATVVSYSRIYVGKHYPLDVVCGALVGLLVACLIYRLYLLYAKDPAPAVR